MHSCKTLGKMGRPVVSSPVGTCSECMRDRSLLHLRGFTLYSPFFLFLVASILPFHSIFILVPVLRNLDLGTVQRSVQIESGRNKGNVRESLRSILYRQPVIRPLPCSNLLLVLLLLARFPHYRATHDFRNLRNP